jgi:lipoprotein-anchoring transpeptidase ErfK/SrfK
VESKLRLFELLNARHGTRSTMIWRFLLGTALCAALVADAGSAAAQRARRPSAQATPVQTGPSYSADERYTGGAPRSGRNYSLFGGWQFNGGGGGGPVTRQTVSFPGNHAPGTIVINTKERRLYFVLGEGRALRYGIGVGRLGFQWGGVHRVTAKKEWPSWTPPSQMLRRRPDLPRHMKGGPENPLGARALYLGSTLYRIHGSNEPETIGQAVSSGCFRMTNEDVIDLYNRAKVGAKVIVLR